MNSGNMMFIFFILEVIVVTILLLIILVGKAFFTIRYKYSSRQYKQLSEELTSCLVHNTPFNQQFRLKNFHSLTTLLSVLEAFSHRFKGGYWHELKNEVSRKHLIVKARKWSKSRSWVKRNFSARVFALTSYSEDEAIVLKLMDDKVFLVSSIASIVAVQNELKDGVYKILQQRSKKKDYGYYFFRDLLLTGSENVLLWIEEFATLDKAPSFHIACLDVLEHSYLSLSQLSLDKDFYSENAKLRLAACRIYAHNPQDDSHQKLIEALSDSDCDIRAEAAKGLSQFYSPETIAPLEKSLSDNDLHVRIQAALSLEKFGEIGINTLKAQNQSTNANAYEAAQYALQFSEGL